MKTVFDKTTRDELIGRINLLNEDSKAQWGKMNAYQMVKHCRLWDEWVASKEKYKQVFIGSLIGKLVLKSILKDENPLRQNTPTVPELVIHEKNGDFTSEKRNWIAKLDQYENFSNPGFIHSFFGKLTDEQIGYLAYKHIDHHLRQFAC